MQANLILVLSLLGFTFALPRPRNKPNFHRGSNVGQKIVGGDEVQPPYSIPWQVSLQLKSWDNWHFCGGVIINDRSVLTAAHCCDGQVAENMQVVGGEHDLYANEGKEQAVNVQQIIMHNDYNANTIENDICLVYTSTPFNLQKPEVSAVDLPGQGQVTPADTIATVSGWGTLADDGPSPDTLQSVDIPIVSDVVCRSAYGQGDIKDSMICAGEAGKDSCQGDSGGPLTDKNTHKLIGLVSFGYGCGEPNYPGVYTEVAHFIDWINSQEPSVVV